jgi:CheY-like chemotaxis protein
MAVVLVVEDDFANAALVSAVLAELGHRVLTSVDGPGALETARSWQPDLVVLDVGLAGALSGLDVCRALRADPSTELVPVLMLSGWAFDSDLEAGRAAGADAYLAKPFTGNDLRTLIENLLARQPVGVRTRPARPRTEAVPRTPDVTPEPARRLRPPSAN